MNKQDFLAALRERLSGLPQQELEERLSFLEEGIADRMEDGLSEEEAVASMGSIDEIVGQIVADVPLAKLVKEKAKKRRRLRTWEIVLLAVGSPVWAPLLIAAIAVIFSLYAVLWAVVASLWALPASLAAVGIAGIAAIVFCSIEGLPIVGLILLGIGIFAAGLTIFATFGCLAATRGVVLLTKAIARGIKLLFVRKGDRS